MAIVVVAAPFAPLGPAYAAESFSTQQIVDSGLVAFQVIAGLSYTPGLRLRATSVASGAWMEGIVSTYTGTTLTMSMQLSFGAGFYSAWNFNLAGESVIVPNQAGIVSNVGLVAESHSGNAVTFSLKTLAGADPSINDTVRALFLNGVSRIISSAITLTIPQGTTLSTVNSTPFRLWFVLIDDNGTIKLGAFQSRLLGSIFSLPANGILPVAMYGGNAGQVYCNSPVTACPFVVIGYVNYESGLATVGNWSASPTRAVLFGPGVRLPGQELQSLVTADGTLVTGSTLIPLDNTIPQITEGVLFLSRAITPLDIISMFDVYGNIMYDAQDTGRTVSGALFRADTGNNALVVTWGSDFGALTLSTRSLNTSLTAKTFTFRGGKDAAGAGINLAMNGSAPSSPYYGGVANSFLRVRELMM